MLTTPLLSRLILVPGLCLNAMMGAIAFGQEASDSVEGPWSSQTHAAILQDDGGDIKAVALPVEKGLSRKAIIVAGGTSADAHRAAFDRVTSLAYAVLQQRGYGEDEITFMSPSALSGVDQAPSFANLEFALDETQNGDTEDMVIYMVGPRTVDGFNLNETEAIEGFELGILIDELETTIPGKIAVIYDGDQSGLFLAGLSAFGVPPRRIVATSTNEVQRALFIDEGRISFSTFFWEQVRNGDSFGTAWEHARQAMILADKGQFAQLDDNEDSLSDGFDGAEAAVYFIGSGAAQPDPSPSIGSIVPAQNLESTDSAEIWVEDIDADVSLSKVLAVILSPEADLETLELTQEGATGRYSAIHAGFAFFGEYDVFVFAIDTDGNVSVPAETSVTRVDAPDAYEDDDAPERASWIGVVGAGGRFQFHNFHDQNDEDWVAFDAFEFQTVTIEAVNVGPDTDMQIELFQADGTSLVLTDDDGVQEGEAAVSWEVEADGRYLVRFTNLTGTFGAGSFYSARVWIESGGCSKGAIGIQPVIAVEVREMGSNVPIKNALVQYTSTIGFPVKEFTLSNGVAIFDGIQSGSGYTINVTKAGYEPSGDQTGFLSCGSDETVFFFLEPIPVAELSVDPSSRNVGNEGGTAEFTVTNIGDGTMTWTAEVLPGADWLTIQSETGTTLTLAAQANASASARQGMVRITAVGDGDAPAENSPVDVTVSQSGAMSMFEPEDVNQDMNINIFDLQVVVNAILTEEVLVGTFPDVNGDMVVNIFDLQEVVNAILSQ